MYSKLNKHISGQGMVETLITIPILLFFGASLLQLYFIWETKLTLNHATLMSARVGATSSLNIQAMNNALVKGLIPLQSPDLAGPLGPANIYADTRDQVILDVANNSVLRIANPTVEAFMDFDIGTGIPNDHLHARSIQAGVNSGINIQDANLLRIQIAYGIPLTVPFVGPFIMDMLNLVVDQNAWAWHRQNTFDNDLFPITSVATVRMQSPSILTLANQPFIMTRQEVVDSIR